MAHRTWLGVLPAALVVWASLAHAVSADVLHAAGLTFSDELGGFRLISVSGSGSRDDPLVIVEDILARIFHEWLDDVFLSEI